MKKTNFKRNLSNNIKEIGNGSKIRGITLISLVITIIILLILAGITISSMQDTNLITRAKETRAFSIVSNYKEKVNMAEMDLIMKIEGNKLNNIDYTATDSEAFNELVNDVAREFNVTPISNTSSLKNSKIASKDIIADGIKVAEVSSFKSINNKGYTVTYYLDREGNSTTEGEGYIVIYYTDKSLKANMFTDSVINKYELTGTILSGTNSQLVLASAIRINNTVCSKSTTGLTTVEAANEDINAESYNSTSLEGQLEFGTKSKLLTTKLTNNQVKDCWRSPAILTPGQNVKLYNFGTAYRYNGSNASIPNNHYVKFTYLGTITTLEDDGLKQNMVSSYPGQDYPVVRLDEYDENNNFIGMYSQGGILYELSKERGVYVFIASAYNSNNSYGYVIFLDNEEATNIQNDGEVTLNCGGILNSLD